MDLKEFSKSLNAPIEVDLNGMSEEDQKSILAYVAAQEVHEKKEKKIKVIMIIGALLGLFIGFLTGSGAVALVLVFVLGLCFPSLVGFH